MGESKKYKLNHFYSTRCSCCVPATVYPDHVSPVSLVRSETLWSETVSVGVIAQWPDQHRDHLPPPHPAHALP